MGTDRQAVAYLNTEQAATYLNISERTLRQLVHDGEIAYCRAGKKLLRFSIADLESWLQRGRVEARTR